MLRASVMDWPHAPPVAENAGALQALRAALAALRILTREPQASEDAPRFSAGAREALAQARDAARRLGLRADGPPVEGWLAQMLLDARQDAGLYLPAQPFDGLSAADDAAVANALALQPEIFARQPALPGRVVETGAFARRGGPRPETGDAGALTQRLLARFEDMAETLAAMQRLMEGENAPEDLTSARRESDGEGFAAVESPRGRLFHQIRLDRAGKVVNYAIVAPTEWNFHPRGPFVRQLERRRHRVRSAGARPGRPAFSAV